MNYQNKKSKKVFSYNELRKYNPLKSLPVDGTPIIDGDWILIESTKCPDHDIHTERAEKLEPKNGKEVWKIKKLSLPTIGQNLSIANENKKLSLEYKVEELLTTANTNPYVGKVVSPNINRHCVHLRIWNRVNDRDYVIEEKTLIRDKALARYELTVLEALETACDIVDGMNSAKEIYATEVSDIIEWPLWVPPI